MRSSPRSIREVVKVAKRFEESVEVGRRFRKQQTFLNYVKRVVKKVLKKRKIKVFDVVICPTCYDVIDAPSEYHFGVIEVWREIFSDLNTIIGEFESEWLFDETGYVSEGEIWVRIHGGD